MGKAIQKALLWFLFFTIAPSSFVWGRALVSDLEAPLGTVWIEDLSHDGTHRLHLHDPSNKRPYSIRFRWSPEGVRLVWDDTDEDGEMIVTRPARHLWIPHPTARRTLEEIYLDLLKNLGFKIPEIQYLEMGPEGLTLSTMDDFLNEAKPPAHLSKRSLDHLISETKNEIATTRAAIASEMFPWLEVTASWIPQALDVVEAIKSSNSVEAARFDAFNLLPLSTLRERGSDLLSAIESAAASPAFNPILYYARHPDLPKNIRLTLIALLTHNHEAELRFIEGVVLTHGIRTGWTTFVNLNNLYASEQNAWTGEMTDFIMSKDDSLLDFLEKTGYPPHDRLIPLKANPLFLRKECGKALQNWDPDFRHGWFPLLKSYHFYGAVLVSMRLRDMKLPDEAVRVLVEYLGQAYKRLSKNTIQADHNLMSNIYADAATQVTLCRW